MSTAVLAAATVSATAGQATGTRQALSGVTFCSPAMQQAAGSGPMASELIRRRVYRSDRAAKTGASSDARDG